MAADFGSLLFADLTVEVAVEQNRFGQSAPTVLRIFANENVMGNGGTFAAVGSHDPDPSGFVHFYESGA